jgi:hypothetical protein
MKYISSAFFIFVVSLPLMMSGCGEDSSSKDDIAPQKPIVVPRSDDAIYPQQGVRPEPSPSAASYWVRVEWQRNPEPDVKGYNVWRGSIDPTEGTLYRVADLEYGFELSNAPGVTQHFWIDVGNGAAGALNLLAPVLGEPQNYFWQIQAFDETGNRSELSDTIRYTLIENPFETTVTRAGPNSYVLSWRYLTGIALNYKIRVYSSYYGRDSVMWDPPLFPGYTSQESISLNQDETARAFERDCTYVWQLNAIRDHEAGAAIFTLFTYQD